MSRRQGHIAAVLFCLFSISGAAAESAEIYRRVDLLETRTGVARLRVVYNPRLNVPVGCEDGSEGCVEGFRFTRLYALELGLESRSADDGGTRINWDDKGEVYLALRFETESEQWFDSALRTYLASLSADAFAHDYARINGVGSPLHGISERSPETSWSCFRTGEGGQVSRYDGFITRDKDGAVEEIKGGMSSFPLSDRNPHLASFMQFCEEMSQSAESAFPDEIRTMPVPRMTRETVVEQNGISSLRREAYDEEMVPIPGEGRFLKKEQPGMLSWNSSSIDGRFTISGRGKDGDSRIAYTEPGEIRADWLADNVWLTRWRIRNEERNLGPQPRTRLISEHELTMALLPTVPSVEVDEDDNPVSTPVPGRQYEIRMDETAFMEGVARRLDKESALDLGTLKRLLTTDPPGFESEGWIQVVCRPDGSALYGLVPTGVTTELLNADLFCAAVEAGLE